MSFPSLPLVHHPVLPEGERVREGTSGDFPQCSLSHVILLGPEYAGRAQSWRAVGTVFFAEAGTWAASYTLLWAPSCHHHVRQALPSLSFGELLSCCSMSLGHLAAAAVLCPHLQRKQEGVGPPTSAASPWFLLQSSPGYSTLLWPGTVWSPPICK